MKRTAHLAVAALAIGGSHFSGMAGEAKTEAPFTWSNPIYFQGKTPKDEIRDPCIIAEGGKYYLVFTVWSFRGRDEKHLADPDQGSSPGIKLFSSPDLKNWTFEKWLLKSSELPEDCPYKHRFWAPEIHKIGGKFYMIFTADNWLAKAHNPAGTWGAAGYAFVGVADKVTGPYEHITTIPGAACDTTLFGDTDGRTYAFMPFGDLFVQEIDLSGLTRPPAAGTSGHPERSEGPLPGLPPSDVTPPSWRLDRGHPAPDVAGKMPATTAGRMPALQQSGAERPIPAAPKGAAQPELRPPKELPPPNPSTSSISSIRWIGERRKILTARNDDIGLDFHPDYLEGP